MSYIFFRPLFLRDFPSSVSKYIVVGRPSRPGGSHWPGVSVCKSTWTVHFRSPWNYHFPECFPEVLWQKRVQYWIQAWVGVRQTMADNLHDDTNSSDLVIVYTFQHQNDLENHNKLLCPSDKLSRPKTRNTKIWIIEKQLWITGLPNKGCRGVRWFFSLL